MSTVLALASALFASTASSEHASAAAAWTYSANGDYAHVTNNQASAHGYWDWTSAGAPVRTAYVLIALQKYNASTGQWVTVATASNPAQGNGSGSGRRTPVNFPCNGTAKTQWRSAVTANINMQPGDTFVKTSTLRTLSQPLNCG
jgi:hypothetical protein